MTLQARIAASIVATLSGSADLSTVKQELSYAPAAVFENGAGPNQANKCFADTRTLSASATENLDLSGSLVDALGVTLAFTKVKAILVRAAAGNTNNVVFGGAGSNGFISPFGDATDKVVVKPGGFALLVAPDAAGYAVAAGTADILLVANSGSGTGVTYDIVIIGA